MTDWISRESLGLIAILKEEFEEVGFMKLVADLKSLNLYKDWPKNKYI